MLVNLVRIGRAKGIQLPKQVIEQCQIDTKLDLMVSGDQIVLTPERKEPRQLWAQEAMRMHKNNDDVLLISDIFEDECVPE